MTTTSSFPFSTMEVPSLDDTMEMASPYEKHADDFDIDIDVMEDQASNADRSMTAADEDMGNFHDMSHENDGSPDEDMLDDEAEPSMVDADDYAEADRNVDVQFDGRKVDDEAKTHEAEMLEEDYDEDIDAPVPEHGHEHEAPAPLHEASNEEALKEDANENGINEDSNKSSVETRLEADTDNSHGSHSKPSPAPEQVADNLDGKKPDEEAEILEPQNLEDSARATNQPDEQTTKTELETTHNHYEETPEDLQNLDEKDGALEEETQASGDQTKGAELDSQRKQSVTESNVQGSEQDHESFDDSPLHPVKVYYQQNEISLFPPREGDSSETYFLEDEDLAYESFGTLLVACREVLQGHIVDNEVLIVDIEALNFQLTEDSRETYNFTLKQIVDVYLQLCQNDGIEEPEALYLTLTTKRTAAEELSELMLAASEGKGLSEIQAWEAYPEGEDAAEYEVAAQEPYSKENEDTLDHQGSVDDLADFETKPASHGQDESSPYQDDQEPQARLISENVDNDEHAIEAPASEGVNATSVDAEVPEAASHDSEGQKTEPTGAVEPLPSEDLNEEQPESGDAAEYGYDDNEDGDNYHEGYKSDEEARPEDAALLPAADPSDDPKELLADNSQHQVEAYDLELEYHEQTSLKGNEPATPSATENKSDTAQEDGGLNVHEVTQDSPKGAEPVFDENPPRQPHQSPDVVNNSLNVAEDFSDQKVQDEAFSQTEHGEIDGSDEGVFSLPPENAEEADLPLEGGEDYLDLGIEDDLAEHDEDHDIAFAGHVSGKRLREPEDEQDLPGSTTPEVKRSRSS